MKFSLVPQERRFYDLFSQQGRLVQDTLLELSKSLLEGFRDLEPRRIEIHRLENETDLVTREALAALFTDDSSPADLVKWKDIYDLLEATMDGCETAAQVLETIAIKNA